MLNTRNSLHVSAAHALPVLKVITSRGAEKKSTNPTSSTSNNSLVLSAQSIGGISGYVHVQPRAARTSASAI